MEAIDWSKTDALIFDMDGTLWDAVDSYCAVWNVCFRLFGVDRTVSRQALIDCMGLTPDKIYDKIVGENPQLEKGEFLLRLTEKEKELMPELGGVPYPGVVDGIERLSKAYTLFLVSNCSENGLRDMMRYIGITPYVKEAVTFGATNRIKSENMEYLKAKYKLKLPVYIGDTEGDCQQTHLAGLPFVWVSYGFGKCDAPDKSFPSFGALTEFFMNIKK